VLEIVFIGNFLQAIGLIIGTLGAFIIGWSDYRTKIQIIEEIKNSNPEAAFKRETARNKRVLALLIILGISFALQLIGFALSLLSS
jgi:hypothetical protein